jgi:hypothetical protein
MSSALAPVYADPVERRLELVAEPGPSRLEVETREQHRWLLVLGIPFVLAAVFMAAAIGTGIMWLVGVSVGIGPVLMVGCYLYLGLSSDSNTPDANS